MDNNTLLQHFDQDLRIDIVYPGMRKDVLPGLVRFVRPAPGMSFISYTDLPASQLDAAVTEQLAYVEEHKLVFSWKTYAHDPQNGLAERLTAHGFAAPAPEPVMLLDLAATPAPLRTPVQANVQRLNSTARLEDVIMIEAQVWGGDFTWLQWRLTGHMHVPGYLSVYVAYADNRPASAAWVYYQANGRFASLFGGSTLPAYRGRGLYTALLAARAQEALARGYRYLLVEPSDMSRPIITRLGFTTLTYAQDYELE
jgi:GNAT superfamily N-acetyltransferase